MSASSSALPDPSTMKVKAMKAELETYGGVRGEIFVERKEIENALVRARAAAASAAAAAAVPSASSASSASLSRCQQERSNISSLSIKDLKSELQSYGMSTESYFDKSSLVQAVTDARAQGWKVPTEGRVPVHCDDRKFATPPFARAANNENHAGNNNSRNGASAPFAAAAAAAASSSSSTSTDPYGPLKDGEEIQVKGSGDALYTIRREGTNYVCNCMGWRYQGRKDGEARTCKHMNELRGDNAVGGGGGDDDDDAKSSSSSKKRAGSSNVRGKKKKVKKSKDDENKDGGGGGEGGLPVTVALAKVWKERDSNVTGWYMSEKLDGMRCVWDGASRLWTRNGNVVHAPQFFTDALPLGTVLDGELFLGRGEFQECMSIARRHGGNKDDWKRLTLVVFDAPEISADFPTRLQAVRAILVGYAVPESIARVLPQTICRGRTHVLEELERVTTAGGEGVMLRNPTARYKGGRSSDLLKVKTFIDAEALVVGYEEGNNRLEGRMGAIVCTMVGSGKQFKIGTGFTDSQREWDNAPPIGSKVSYRYFELTKAGIPRFPAFIRIRPAE